MVQASIDVLVIDDSDPQARSTLLGIRRAAPQAHVVRLKDGDQAVQFLSCSGIFSARDASQMPGLILLDLELPSIGGIELLERLRTMPETREIPVAVVTQTSNPVLIEQSYALGARAFIVKPFDPGEYVFEVARVVDRLLTNKKH